MSQQDGVHLEAEEQRLLNFAETYAMCDNAIVALNNMRTGKCHIFVAVTTTILVIMNAWAALKLYDLPVRAWLKEHWLKK